MRRKDIFNTIFFILVGVLALFIVSIEVFPKVVSGFMPYKHYIVISGSMEPVIGVYDVVVVKDVDKASLNVGDVITFRTMINQQEEYVTHYVAGKDEDKFRTRPHVSDQWDPWEISNEQIEGKVVLVIPKVGRILLFLYNNAVPLLLATNAIVIFTIYKVYTEKDTSEE